MKHKYTRKGIYNLILKFAHDYSLCITADAKFELFLIAEKAIELRATTDKQAR